MSYFLKAAGLGTLFMAVALLVKGSMPAGWYPVHLPALVLFFVVASTALHAFIARFTAQNPRMFAAYFLGFTGIKLMLYLLLIVAYALVYKEAAVPFTIAFLMLYMAYTLLEVVELVRKKVG